MPEPIDIEALKDERDGLHEHVFGHAGVFLDRYTGDCAQCQRFYEIDDVIRTVGGRRQAAWDAEMILRRREVLGPIEDELR